MKPGTYDKLPMQQYLGLRAFSSGLAHTLLSRSPYHAWIESPWNPDRERDDSKTADIGTYAHAMLLEGGTESLVVCPYADWRKNEATKMRDAARAVGKLPILEEKVAEVAAMVKAAKDFVASSEIAGVFDTGAPEQTIVAELDGLLCKCRPDWLSDKICLSYKTTEASAEPNSWIRRQLPQYDLGIVLYERLTGRWVVTIVQEQNAPYACSLIGLDPAWQQMAETRLQLAMATWKSCLGLNDFPAYPTQICWAAPKPWQLAETEEQEAERSVADPAVLFGGIKE